MLPPSMEPTATMCLPQTWLRVASVPSPPTCSVRSVPAFREFIWLETPALGTISTLVPVLAFEPSLAYTNLRGVSSVFGPLGFFHTRKTADSGTDFAVMQVDAASRRGMPGFKLDRPRAERSYEPPSARTSSTRATGRSSAEPCFHCQLCRCLPAVERLDLPHRPHRRFVRYHRRCLPVWIA